MPKRDVAKLICTKFLNNFSSFDALLPYLKPISNIQPEWSVHSNMHFVTQPSLNYPFYGHFIARTRQIRAIVGHFKLNYRKIERPAEEIEACFSWARKSSVRPMYQDCNCIKACLPILV